MEFKRKTESVEGGTGDEYTLESIAEMKSRWKYQGNDRRRWRERGEGDRV